jgi:outer membrane PBP1 activator LpoA protein
MAKNKLQLFMIVATALTMLTACSESDTTTEPTAAAKQDEALDIDTLMKHAEEARAEADKLGFEWSVTAPLLEEAHAAVKAGNHEQAIALFQEVKHQSMLAIEQAHYANKHWQLLVPVND